MPTRVLNSGGIEAGGVFIERRVVFKDAEENGLFKNTVIQNNYSYSESSSSIGKNSDLSEKSEDGEEVQSTYNKGALDAMDALEEVLPIRRGISSFYNGKSKSFASLAHASSFSSSIKDIAKPDNVYARKRRNLLSCSLNWENKNRKPSCLGSNCGGISKKTASSSRTTLALGVAMSEKDSDVGKRGGGGKLGISPWRSFSLADLQHCVSVGKNSCSPISECQLEFAG
ncbi:MTD1 family protein [Striga asiatica]|uniref:MTD1 family protein n=1 Tax=Striga asiatica TaxID=4170 RepID=A0A5A7PHJ7_STRAF|nr:MTD1 family protein [Striga asiatica]